MRITDRDGLPTRAGWTVLLAGITVVIAALVLAATGGAWHSSHVACLRLHEQTGYPTRMVGTMWGGGCYIKVEGRWIPDSRYRMVDMNQ